MPTTGIVNGKLLRILDGSNTLAYATECSLSLSGETRDTSNKDSGGWRELATGLKSGTLTTNLLYAFDGTHGFSELFAKFTAGTLISWKYSTEVTGDDYYSGSAYITSMEINAPNEENSTASITMEVTGAVSEAAVV